MDSLDYREVLQDLYQKINPVGGKIGHRISPSIIKTGFIDSLWVEFDLLSFSYEDPFYGNIQVENNFKMFFETTFNDKLINIQNIKELETKEYRFDINQLTGCFSNSIDFKIIRCSFGKLENLTIPIDVEYFLTNSDSYGRMTGTLEEHSQLKGQMKTKLHVDDMIVQDSSKSENISLEVYIRSDIYDLNKKYLANDGYSDQSINVYKVPVRK